MQPQDHGPSALSYFDLRRIGVAAYADERTIARYLTGYPVRGATAARIERALRELGYETLVRPTPGAP